MSQKIADELIIPKKEDDITEDWVRKATNFVVKEGSVSITGNIQDGLGFLSNICRVTFQSEGDKEESILVKLPPQSGAFIEFATNQKVDHREIQFYSVVKPLIEEIVPDLEKNMCKYYCSKITGGEHGEDYNSMLVFEDLKGEGYQTLNPESPNWKSNLERIMKFAAKLHASGFALEKAKNKKISEIFPFCMGGVEEGEHNLWLELGKANFLRLEAFLLQENLPKDTTETYSKLSDHAEQIFYKIFKKGCDTPCLSHGDIWPPNVMVNEDGPLKFIDWQLLSYRDASYDLALGIVSCLPVKELKKENVDYFLKLYYKEFLSACECHGCPYTTRSEEAFLEFFNTWGMASGFYWYLISIDAFEDYEAKLAKIFQFFHETYKIPEFLLSVCENK